MHACRCAGQWWKSQHITSWSLSGKNALTRLFPIWHQVWSMIPKAPYIVWGRGVVVANDGSCAPHVPKILDLGKAAPKRPFHFCLFLRYTFLNTHYSVLREGRLAVALWTILAAGDRRRVQKWPGRQRTFRLLPIHPRLRIRPPQPPAYKIRGLRVVVALLC